MTSKRDAGTSRHQRHTLINHHRVPQLRQHTESCECRTLHQTLGNNLQTLDIRPSTINHYGCFTLVPIAKRKKIAAYAGQLIRGQRQVSSRLRAQTAAGVMKIITLTEELAIDAAVGGDATAFINHSCQPNAFMRIVPGSQVMFFALRDIRAGEEITINYRNPDIMAVDGCGCGTPRCRSQASASTSHR